LTALASGLLGSFGFGVEAGFNSFYSSFFGSVCFDSYLDSSFLGWTCFFYRLYSYFGVSFGLSTTLGVIFSTGVTFCSLISTFGLMSGFFCSNFTYS
jgi:hypothetical protein